MQPLFLLLVFGKILGSLGYTRPGYAQLLFPGLLSLTVVITSMQSLAFPLVAEFGWTMEIEDRLLAPLPTSLVAAEKVIYASLRAFIATVIMLPIGVLVLGTIPWEWGNFGLFVLMLVLGALLGSGIGLVMGTYITPQRISIAFSLIFTPLLFTGSSSYDWPSLSRVPWFQFITALNPMTYVSEGMRAALDPAVPHINPLVGVAVLTLSIVVLFIVGVQGFYRRAIN